ncbi:flagellar hook assembly protein FlgD [Sphingomonas sp. 179-I 2A4 NHS]|uniref:flagellar hook assembly protein FlgD n=1 Tax=unclassified Sphingomonas TaxID=196159 RepID=UPI003879657F
MATSFDATIGNLGIGTANAAAKNAAAKSPTMGQADFLKLMTAQMKNQDPFDPVDNTQMVAQMAQFSSLAGITEMGSTLKAIADKLGATSMQDAVSYVGRTVLTPGNVAYGRASGGIAGGIELGADASNVTVAISDANGQLLHSADLGAQKAGTVSYDWDGKTAAGADAGPGPFTVSISANDGSGSVAANSLVWAPVTSVSTTSGAAVLTLPGIGEVPATAVRQIG